MLSQVKFRARGTWVNLMYSMKTTRPDIQLLPPDVQRDAPFAHSWLSSPEGKDTLLSMGNAESEIVPSTLEGEAETLRGFIMLEKNGKRITRMIIADGATIGAVWIELAESHGVSPPSVHIMIGDPSYRGKGIGRAVMHAAIAYTFEELGCVVVYSRHLVSNAAIDKLNKGLGFADDGEPYTDNNHLAWQNVKLERNRFR